MTAMAISTLCSIRLRWMNLLSAAFDMLRHASADTAQVLLPMPDTVEGISQETKSPDARQNLHRHVESYQDGKPFQFLCRRGPSSLYS